MREQLPSSLRPPIENIQVDCYICNKKIRKFTEDYYCVGCGNLFCLDCYHIEADDYRSLCKPCRYRLS